MENALVVIKTFLGVLVIFASSPAIVAHKAIVAHEEFVAEKGITRGATNGVPSYGKFKADKFSYLNITSIGGDLVERNTFCAFACLETHPCFSFNLAAFPDINGKFLCELLPSDKYSNSDKLVPNKFFHHYSIASPCFSWPCKNDGKCIPLYEENSYVCVCKDGFTGKNCQKDINECDSNPCLNNGTCVDQVNGFNCTCPPGFAGNRCEADINECDSNPCLNNGTCVDQVNGFNCTCPAGFAGNLCETDINECDSNSCLNNGTCVDQINSFYCTCSPGFAGNLCEIVLSMASAIIADNAVYQSHLDQFLAPAVGNDPKWLLCYRASTHGWDISNFHSRCDGKRNTVTIIKVGVYVFGGYTDIPWESSDDYGSTSNAFIFSLRNKEGLGPLKSLVTWPSYAIYRGSGIGPTFGGGYDIKTANNANSNRESYARVGHSYSVPSGVQDPNTILAGTFAFTPDVWEVFYLA